VKQKPAGGLENGLRTCGEGRNHEKSPRWSWQETKWGNAGVKHRNAEKF
jgi:hypothetical protein